MKQRAGMAVAAAIMLAMGAAACGSSGGGGTTPDTDNLTTATTLTMLGTTPSATGGTCRFTAADSSGSALLAYVSPNATERLKIAVWNLLMSEALAQALGCTCTATTNDSSYLTPTCSITDITSTPGAGASGGTVATGIVIDNTGSMSSNDPSQLRKTAAQAAIDALAAGTVSGATTSNNLVFVSDFSTSTSATAPFTDVRQDFAWAVLNTTANVTAAKNAVVAEDGGGTNLWDSIIDVCTDMKSASVAVVTTQGTRNGHFAAAAPGTSNSTIIDTATKKTMLILTDGQNNSSTDSAADVVTCLQAGSGNDDIVAYVVGLGDSLDTTDLTTIANANNGIFTQVTDAAALTPTFEALVGAATSGYNTASYTLKDSSGTAITIVAGTTVTINLTCGSAGTATGVATYVQPTI